MNNWTSVNDKLPRLDVLVKVKTAFGEKHGRLVMRMGVKQWNIEDWGFVPLWRVYGWKPEKSDE